MSMEDFPKPKLTPELKVTDYNKSLDFYCRLAGFKILYDRLEDEFAMLDREGARIMIEALTDGSRTWKVAPLEHPFGRGMHFQIEVSDVDSLYINFKYNNYPIFFEIEEKWYRSGSEQLGNRQFLVQDPDGYLLRFYENVGTKVVEF